MEMKPPFGLKQQLLNSEQQSCIAAGKNEGKAYSWLKLLWLEFMEMK